MTEPRWTDLASVEGLISEDVGRMLATLAGEVPRELTIVEIGSYKGRSTCYLAEGARCGAGARVWAVDAWDLPGNPEGRFGFTRPETREAFDANVRRLRLRTRVTEIRNFGPAAGRAWKGPQVGLLYVDGSHLYQDVRADHEAWLPHLATDAVVVFDDYQTARNPGVTRYVDELRRTGGRWIFEPAPLAIRHPS